MAGKGYGGLRKGFGEAAKTADWTPGVYKPPAAPKAPRRPYLRLPEEIEAERSIERMKPRIAQRQEENRRIRAGKDFDRRYGTGRKR